MLAIFFVEHCSFISIIHQTITTRTAQWIFLEFVQEVKKNELCPVVLMALFTKLLFKMDFWVFLSSDDP